MSVILSKIKHQTVERILWAMLHGKFNRDENRVSVTQPSTPATHLIQSSAHTGQQSGNRCIFEKDGAQLWIQHDFEANKQ